MNPAIPKALGEAMATGMLWPRPWTQTLVAAHLAATLFVVGPSDVVRPLMGDGVLRGR